MNADETVNEKRDIIMNITNRPRRLRSTPAIRGLVRGTRMSQDSLILPLFIREGMGILEEIPSMPGQYRYSVDTLSRGIEPALKCGVSAVLLFGIPADKDALGSGAWAEEGAVQQAVRFLRERYPRLLVITDVCMCEYTSHGHCGVLRGGTVDNDETLPLLARTALSHVEAGAHMVAPSDMMDGRVAGIRRALDERGYTDIPLMSYAVKYASAFYGPFREAAGSAPGVGDRKGYQMDPHNAREALLEARLDAEEGADILMVKPALAYLDIIKDLSGREERPVAAYSVSGEYAMIKSAAAAGFIDEYGAMCESAVSIFRAGADILVTYYACQLAQAIQKGDIG